ncbi:MAG: AAA family ATPase [Acetatifactor sp.]|nr:AAA family ATPase [Acetatifactor sp.]
MRIVNCHVENFGKLHDMDLDFSQGLNRFCEDNGWGKSTLAAFIRVMFFGFAGDRKRDISENERKRFQPWQGGTYGGRLTFETKGKQYVVSRVFQDKEANDLFELRDAGTNLESKDFSANLGEELFQINRESFLRSAFISQNDCITGVTDSINAKMGNLADNTGDLDSYEAADARIQGIINSMSPSRKTGNLYKKKAYLTELSTRIREGEGLEEGLDRVQKLQEKARAECKDLTERLTDIRALQAKASRMKDLAAEKEKYVRLLEDDKEKQKQLQMQKDKFPMGVPAAEEVRTMQEEATAWEQAKKAVSIYQLTDEETKELVKLGEKFSGEPLSAEDFNLIAGKVRRYNELHHKTLENRMPEEELEQLRRLSERFGEETMPAQTVNRLLNRWNDMDMRKRTLEMVRIHYETQTLHGGIPKKLGIVMMLLGLAVISVGVCIYLALLELPIPALPVIGAGGGLSLIGIIMMLVGKRKEREEYLTKQLPLKKQMEEDEDTIEEIREEVYAFLRRLQIECDESNVNYRLQKLAEEAASYEWLKERKARDKSDVYLMECEGLREELTFFFKKYASVDSIDAVTDDFAEKLSKIREEWNRFVSLSERSEKTENEQAAVQRMQERLDGRLERYGLIRQENLTAQLMNLLQDVTDYGHVQNAADSARKSLETFETENDVAALKVETIDELPDLEDLNGKYQEAQERRQRLQEQLLDYEQQTNDYRDQIDEWMSLREELEKVSQEYRLEEKQFGHFKKVQEYLAKAKESMTAQYMAPLHDSFSRYYETVTGKDADKYHFDANAKVTVEEAGMQRETEYFSMGYQDLIGICLRLAFVDAMYPDEAPTLFLDDPFVNLDDKNRIGAAKLLKKVSERYQIIYFTCSLGRNEG